MIRNEGNISNHIIYYLNQTPAFSKGVKKIIRCDWICFKCQLDEFLSGTKILLEDSSKYVNIVVQS